jgi:transposase
VIFVGDDWSEDHHDVEVHDETGKRLARRRLPEGLEGIAQLHGLVGEHADDPAEVVVGIETDRGLWVAALVAAGYEVYAINPKAVSRYRDRYGGGSGAKSDAGDAKVLADLVRTDRHNHRPVAGDSHLAEAIKVLARAHQRLIWSRQRQVNSLRATLREFYPAALAAFGTELAARDALAVLGRAPTPAKARALSRPSIAAALRRAGRRRNIEARAAEIHAALRTEQLEPPAVLADAFGAAVAASVAVLAEMNRQVKALEAELGRAFEQHPDAEIIRSQPGLGAVVGARVLGEFGDDPNRCADAKARRNYASTAPITVRLREEEGGQSPLHREPPPGRRLLLVGVLRPHPLRRGASLLRRTPRQGRQPRPGAPRPRQPPRRHPRRVPTQPHPLQRSHRLGPVRPQPRRGRMTPPPRLPLDTHGPWDV